MVWLKEWSCGITGVIERDNVDIKWVYVRIFMYVISVLVGVNRKVEASDCSGGGKLGFEDIRNILISFTSSYNFFFILFFFF